MGQIAVISTNSDLNDKIAQHFSDSAGTFVPEFLPDERRVLEFLNYELPELSIINLGDGELAIDEIVRAIQADPWLHYGGLICVHPDQTAGDWEKRLTAGNVVSFIPQHDLDFSLPRVIRILGNNRQFLFQREIQDRLLNRIAGTFVIDNDPLDIRTYAHLLTNYLYNANYLSGEQRDALLVALMELLMNAIEHGNCQISSSEKTDWLEAGNNIFDLIRAKNGTPAISARKVHMYYRIEPDKSSIRVRDEGDGFDWRSRTKAITEKNYESLHGRGILMADHYVSNLTYNDKGNEVGFEIGHQRDESNTRPEAFASEQEVVFEPGETVFNEGEESSYLYYIVSGQLNVVARGTVVSTLTPDDIFLGEMSFLLNNQRSASVQANVRSRLLRISKESFVNVVKRQPYYGIFLARLLAQRLDRLNQRIKRSS